MLEDIESFYSCNTFTIRGVFGGTSSSKLMDALPFSGKRINEYCEVSEGRLEVSLMKLTGVSRE